MQLTSVKSTFQTMPSSRSKSKLKPTYQVSKRALKWRLH